jgi:hypothetical protein
VFFALRAWSQMALGSRPKYVPTFHRWGIQVGDRELIAELRQLTCWRPINIRLGKMLLAAADRIEGLIVERDNWPTERSPVEVPPALP